MGTSGDNPLGIYYEHPTWHRPLFAELDRRGIRYEGIDAVRHAFDPRAESRYSLVFNRMSPSAYLRGAGHAVFYTTAWLAHLDAKGARVVNGSAAWEIEVSKARQLALLDRLGLPHPATRVIHRASDAVAAAEGLRFPVIVKPNIGGSGAGIRRFDEFAGLRDAVQSRALDLGVDHTALVQEFIPRADSRIVRVEVLGGRFLYAIGVHAAENDFDLCPADLCGADGDGGSGEWSDDGSDPAPAPGARAEGTTPPREVIEQVERVVAAAGIEVGGVEYLVDARDGSVCFYDINALSNFVADAPRIVGFDPFARLVDWLEDQAALAIARRSAAA